jgi:hypothetical protein
MWDIPPVLVINSKDDGMSAELLTEYDATLDSKKRFVVRGLPGFNHYHVKVFKDPKSEGYTLKMEPRVLAGLDQLSEKTLRMMDAAMKNIAKGVASEPVDIEKMKELADDLPD